MKKLPLFFFATFVCILTLSAQPNGQHNNGNRHGNRNHHRPNKKNIRFATMENGRKIVLFPDGTWEFAAVQAPAPPPRPNFSSELWGANLIIDINGQEIDRVPYMHNRDYNRITKSYIADIVFGNMNYTFHEKTREVRFKGKKLIGQARNFDDAKDMAAYHYTNEVYNGLTSKFWGGNLIIKLHGKEIDRVRVSHNTDYDRYTKCYYTGYTLGTANYQYDHCEEHVRFMGDRSVGKAFTKMGAKYLAAYHFIREHYKPADVYTCN